MLAVAASLLRGLLETWICASKSGKALLSDSALDYPKYTGSSDVVLHYHAAVGKILEFGYILEFVQRRRPLKPLYLYESPKS
jgi:hypothetical protein